MTHFFSMDKIAFNVNLSADQCERYHNDIRELFEWDMNISRTKQIYFRSHFTEMQSLTFSTNKQYTNEYFSLTLLHLLSGRKKTSSSARLPVYFVRRSTKMIIASWMNRMNDNVTHPIYAHFECARYTEWCGCCSFAQYRVYAVWKEQTGYNF